MPRYENAQKEQFTEVTVDGSTVSVTLGKLGEQGKLSKTTYPTTRCAHTRFAQVVEGLPKKGFVHCSALTLREFSLRAQIVLGVLCLRRYCARHRLEYVDVDEFALHMCHAAVSHSMTAWDDETRTLAITGLGDPMREELASNRCTACHGALKYLDPRVHDIETEQLACVACGGMFDVATFASGTLAEILSWIREISATQMYGAWRPDEALACLGNIAARCEVDLEHDIELTLLAKHSIESGPWGRPVSRAQLGAWLGNENAWLEQAERRLDHGRAAQKKRFAAAFKAWLAALSPKQRRALATDLDRGSKAETSVLREAFVKQSGFELRRFNIAMR